MAARRRLPGGEALDHRHGVEHQPDAAGEGGLDVALGLAALSPDLLAHGNLVTTDAGAEYFNGKLSDSAGTQRVRCLGVALGADGEILAEDRRPTPRGPGSLPKLIDTLADLHNIDYEKAGLGDYGKPGNYFERQIGRWSKQYVAAETGTIEEMNNLMTWLPTAIPSDDATSIVHGDYRFDNAIMHPTEPKVLAMLDWELSTIGHPLADVGYFLMPHRLDAAVFPWGIRGVDADAIGIPPEQALLETYARSAALDEVPAIDFYIAFAMFRLAAILAGVLRRGLDGNASDPRAVEQGRMYAQLAAAALGIARNC